MIKFQISCGFLNFDRVSQNVNGNLEREIWIKFGIWQRTGGCKGPGGKLEGDFSVTCFTFIQ